MITTFDISEIIWKRLAFSELKTVITGGVYLDGSRPANSNKEDIVVGCLPVNNAQIQEAIVNVNIHVPNKTINVNGIQDSVPDLERLKGLTRIAVDLLEGWSEDYNYEVQQQNMFKEGSEHYANIRIEFININI